MPIHRIVLTGGPCGGKTTALTKISERFTSLGFRVFLAPEVPTLLVQGGVSFAGNTPEQFIAIEANVLRAQLAMEDSFCGIAEASGVPSIIMYDRGALDVSAYLPGDSWQALLDESGHTTVGLRDRRYDAVLHLVTAADGAEAFYTTANNAARTETPEQARALDRRVRDAWLGHRAHHIIRNEGSFGEKISRVLDVVSRVTGTPSLAGSERKYLLREAPEVLPIEHVTVTIEQAYLLATDGSEVRVRRRGQRGAYAYSHTIRKPTKDGQRVEVDRSISGREYVGLMGQRDPSRRVVSKERRCFAWEGQIFRLDRFASPRPGMLVLEAEVHDPSRPVALPPWLVVDRDVTDDKAYSNFALAAV